MNCMLTDYFKVKVSLLVRYVVDMNAVYWLTISCSFRLICNNLLSNFLMNHDWNVAKKKVVIHLRFNYYFLVCKYREKAIDLLIFSQVALEKRHAIFLLL